MKYILITALALISFGTLQSQSGWKDMGGYKESIDSASTPFQMICSPDGKYLYTYTATKEGKIWNYTLRKWNLDSGTIVFSHLLDAQDFAQIDCICFYSDGRTYSLHCVKKSSLDVYTLLVRNNDTDEEIVSISDTEISAVTQLDYDSILHSFYIGYNSFYVDGSSKRTKYSIGAFKKKTVSGDSLIERVLFTPNTERFVHKFGTDVLGVISNYSYEEVYVSRNTNYINYAGILPDTCLKLATYTLKDFPVNSIALSPNGKHIAATNGNTFTTWYVDSSRASQLCIYPYTVNSLVYTADNNYILANSPNDNTIYTIRPGTREVCGTLKLPIANLITQFLVIPHSNYVVAACKDRRIRIINAFIDTVAAVYSFSVDKVKIYQGDTVSLCPVIPSLDSSIIEWNFGDTKTSTLINPRHKFTAPGLYDISMSVKDNTGEHTVTQKKIIEVLPLDLVIDFDADTTYGSAPHTVHFKNKSSGSIVSYKWDFGDKTTSIEKDPVHTFTSQRSYSISLTINDGIKDTTHTKYHYINADIYPSYALKTKLVKRIAGSSDMFGNQTITNSNIFETMLRDDSGYVYLKHTLYHEESGTRQFNTPYTYCGVSTNIVWLEKENGYFNSFFSTSYDTRDINQYPCNYQNGTLGLLQNNTLSYFVFLFPYSPPTGHILSINAGSRYVDFPFLTGYYTVRPLKNSIDCYSFRKEENIPSNNISYLSFYTNTNTLLSVDTIPGYALPAIETGTSRMLSVVSPADGSKWLQFRWYDPNGSFIDSTVIVRPNYEFIYDIIRLPNNKYMLCGYSGDTKNGLLLIIDEHGSVELRKEVPQWNTLKKITKMDDSTYAVTGSPDISSPGFIAVKSNGTIVGDFRGDITLGTINGSTNITQCQTCIDVSFGKNMNTVFFTRNDGYNAELYVSENPYLKDIHVSVVEEKNPEIPVENSIVFSPNPTEGMTTIEYTSTVFQKITITIVSVLGEVVLRQEVPVQAGKNIIPLDVHGYSSGVAFVSVSDNVSIHHGQVHIIK